METVEKRTQIQVEAPWWIIIATLCLVAILGCQLVLTYELTFLLRHVNHLLTVEEQAAYNTPAELPAGFTQQVDDVYAGRTSVTVVAIARITTNDVVEFVETNIVLRTYSPSLGYTNGMPTNSVSKLIAATNRVCTTNYIETLGTQEWRTLVLTNGTGVIETQEVISACSSNILSGPPRKKKVFGW